MLQIKGWHFDHIIPCSWFNLSRGEHILVCFNWRNIRPLPAAKNSARNDVMTKDEWKQIPDDLMLLAASVGIDENCITGRLKK